MAVILSRFFGPFLVDTDLPGTFEGTLNSIEKLMHICKDVPVVLDDLVKGAGGTRIKAENLARQIINTVAERTRRTRLQRDLTERQTFTPRGVVVFTMEDQIEGHSGMARTIDVEFNVADWDHATIHGALTELGPYLPHAMRYFVTWMKTTPGLKARFLKHKERVREGMNEEGTHGRTSDNLAHLMAVGDALCEWLKHADVNADDVAVEITENIKVLQHAQVTGVAEADPILGLMHAIAENRESWFATRNPKDYEHASRDSDTWEFNDDERDATQHRQDVKDWEEGKKAGWVHGGNYLIRPKAFHAELNEHYRRSGASGFPLGVRQAAKQICDKGYATRDPKGQTACVVRIDGVATTQRVIVVPEAAVTGVTGDVGQQ